MLLTNCNLTWLIISYKGPSHFVFFISMKLLLWISWTIFCIYQQKQTVLRTLLSSFTWLRLMIWSNTLFHMQENVQSSKCANSLLNVANSYLTNQLSEISHQHLEAIGDKNQTSSSSTLNNLRRDCCLKIIKFILYFYIDFCLRCI